MPLFLGMRWTPEQPRETRAQPWVPAWVGGARLGAFGGAVGSGCIAQGAAALQWAQAGEEAGIPYGCLGKQGWGCGCPFPWGGASAGQGISQRNPGAGEILLCPHPTAPRPGVVGGSSSP